MKRMFYGVSSTFNFGKWNHNVVKFNNEEEANKWLRTEEYNFSEREIMTKTAAIKLAGRKAVENAISYEEWEILTFWRY